MYGTLRTSAVQTWLAKKAAAYLSQQLHTRIEIGGLDIAWFFDIVLEDVVVTDRSGADIIRAGRIKIDLGKLDARRRYLGIYALSMKNASIHLYIRPADSLMNFQFIADYFSGSGTDTTSAAPWTIGLSGIGLRNCTFRYDNYLKSWSQQGVDYDHIFVTHLNADIRNLKSAGDSITAQIRELSLHEKSGFQLNNFTANCRFSADSVSARNLSIITPHTNLNLDLTFHHRNLDAYNHFIDSVYMTGNFAASEINMNDISYFAPEMTGMDNAIRIKGLVKGTVSALKAKNFEFDYGSNTRFEGNISMDGLPDIDETFVHLKVKKLSADYTDLSNFKLPGNTRITMPELVKTLGTINIKGYFTGFYYDFVSAADFKTSMGSISTDLSLKMADKHVIDYNGHLAINGWDLGNTFNQQGGLGLLDFSSVITGKVTNLKVFDVDVDGNINRLGLYGNTFYNIDINGELKNREFNGDLKVHDKLINLDFTGFIDLSDTLPRFNFTSNIQNAMLSKLHIWDRDSTSCLSTRMNLDFTGSNIDNMLGSLRFDSTSYSEKELSYFVKNIDLVTNHTTLNSRLLSLKSDLVDADFSGRFSFADFYNSLTNIISAYLPSIQLSERKEQTIKSEQFFEYSVFLRNVDPLTELFVPGLDLDSDANFFGSFNSTTKTILLNGQINQFTYKGVLFDKWYIRGQNVDRSLEITTGNASVVWKEPSEDDPQRLGIDNFVINMRMQGDSVATAINWKNNDSATINNGDIRLSLLFSEGGRINSWLGKTDLIINNNIWTIAQDGNLLIDSTTIIVDNLTIAGNNQQLKLNGTISKNPEDVFSLWFDHLDISNADALINRNDLNFDGILNGRITLTDLYHTMLLQSDLTVEKFAFNNEKMGDARILSWWDNTKDGLGIDASVQYKGNVSTHNPILVKGYIYPESRDSNNFNLDIDLVNYKLASLNPFVSDFASHLKGMASGNLKMTGSFNKPALNGKIQLLRTEMKIDYLNVTYSFADEITLNPYLISVSNLAVYDSLGNSGSCNFNLHHDHFSKMNLDIDLNAKNLAGLNTAYKSTEMYYGSAFASGNVKISGPFDDIKMKIAVTSEPNTNIYIPINLAVGASENDFIRFVNHAQKPLETLPFEASSTGVSVDMLMNITKDAAIQLFLPEDIGNIKGNGTGTIQMGVDTQGDITMFGDYTMNSGTFLFTFKNLFNRVFSIENGGTLSFNGSPYDAEIDMNAVYKVRASLKGIPELADYQEYAGKTMPVDCIISLKNNLYNPDIKFNIRLPEADALIKQRIYSAIDTTNEVVMTQQMVSLLILKSFSFSSSNASLASTVGSSSIEMVTNQLSNMLSQISKDVDIGLNYRTGDVLSSEEIELALSTHLFNDRVTIDGNLGMTTSGTTQNANNIVGDVNIDVKITPDGRFRVKAFNKANNPFDISSTYATYKQGVGVYYKYEFDKFSELFRRQRKKSPPLQ